MKKSSFLGGALLLSALFTTSCKEIMSNLDQPVSSYLAPAKDSVMVPLGETYQIVVSTINKENPISYESSDPNVATVDSKGLVTTVSDGKAIITIKVKGDQYYNEGTATVKIWSRDTDLWEPLTLEAAEDGWLGLNCWDYYRTEPVKYTINDGNEQEVGNSAVYFALNKGDKVKLYSKNTYLNYFNIQGTKLYAYGNVMSMVSPDGNWYDNKKITDNYAFNYLFNYTKIQKHETRKLMLPATTLTTGCYYSMFRNSTITEAPELPAENLAESCYSNMFAGCTALTKAPALPAKKLASYCYNYMFSDCTALTEAPELKAEDLTDCSGCYYGMFANCKKLAKAPELPAEKMESRCYSDMFAGCTSLTKAPALPAKKLASYCYNYMFGGCTALTEAPELKAETLADNCYNNMFNGCSKLNKVVCLATTNATNALYYWLDGAGTDASVTKRTLVRAESNKKWTNNDGWTGTANWYVPTSWTIEPEIIKTIVLVPGVWDLDDARFAAYVWKGSENKWYLFSKTNDKWTTNIPATYTGLVLVRLDNGTEVNWGDNVWNQTSDIDFTQVVDNSTISITGWGGPGNKDPYTITAP